MPLRVPRPDIRELTEFQWTDGLGQLRCVWGYYGDIAFLKDILDPKPVAFTDKINEVPLPPATNQDLLSYDERTRVKQVAIRGCAELTNRLFCPAIATNDIQEVFIHMLGD